MLTSPLSHAQLEQYRSYLDQMEAKLADALSLSILQTPAMGVKLHLHGSGHFRLSQSLQLLSTKIRELKEDETSPGSWQSAVAVSNQALQEYVKVLEEGVLELNEQVNESDISGWTQDYFEVIAGFKELLAHRIEDTIWIFRRLEDTLLTYRAICRRHKNLWVLFGNFWGPFLTILDKSLLSKLFRVEEELSSGFKQFAVRYEAFCLYEGHAKKEEEKFQNFAVFGTLQKTEQNLLGKLSFLVSIWELNSLQEVLKASGLVQSIRGLAKAGTCTSVFKDYYRAIKQFLISYSLEWQSTHQETISAEIDHLKLELSAFGHLVTEYREILLRTDANPHVRTSWGITHLIAGKEPRKTRDLQLLIDEIDRLKKWVDHLHRTIENGALQDSRIHRQQLERQIDEVLHEMGQPLSSRSLIQTKVERLVELIDQADELGGSLGDVRQLLSFTFQKALKLDSKYQTLQDYKRFDELYSIHREYFLPLHDKAHTDRIHLFQNVLRHIDHWVSENAVAEHVKELEVDEAAIQEALQGALAAVQRGEIRKEAGLQMLLEYRYLFSNLFYLLRKDGQEGKIIRKQFFFVDQYFDAIEECLTHLEFSNRTLA